MSTDPGRALRRAALAIGLVWLPIILVWGPIPHALTFDDAWYYFQIARNVADGAGSTFDGMNETNGYHPLWLGVCALAYLVGLDELAAVRALLVVQLGLWVGALWVMAAAVGRAIAGWPALTGRRDADRAARRCTAVVTTMFVLVAGNPFVLKLFVNGMESGLVALTGALLLALAIRHDGDLLARPWVLAALLSVAFLARTDMAVIAGTAFLWALAGVAGRWRRFAAAFGPVAAVGIAYLASNQIAFGHPMQISGVIKRLPLTPSRVAVTAVFAVFALAVAVAGRRLGNDSGRYKLPRTAAYVGATAWFAAGGVLLLAYDRVLSTESYLWHFAAHGLWAFGLLLHAVADLVEGSVAERPAADERAAARPLTVGAVVLLPFALGGAWQTARFTDPELYGLQVNDRRAAEFVAANLAAGAVVGSFDAGVVGYFAERTVVNLDGLVNSFEYRDARREGPEATRSFLLDAGVTHLVNHGDPVDGDNPTLRASADRLFGDGAGARMELVERIDFVFSGTAGGRSGRRPYAVFVYELRP